ncbi:dynein regulatory complex subunit 3-like [Diorhabda sublineata]|uniref:dynein regulatory complex subunit 3-like n=1 Tax=Diorhabda sublineata TaxID=1163346 RepID=UPI0024E15AEA|nr:dynein regulatory complex subunit 3-like [Diorhabda sublineata]
MAVTDPCKAREPKVIDNALIERCIDLQFPKGKVGMLMRADGMRMDQIEEMRFEFMNILKIDHLWVFKSLVKLKLNNNYIEKIENLSMLVHLEELDLSFNKISKIENVESLTKLKKLKLYENLIEKIEGLDNLKHLAVLSLGRNKISDKTEIHYLRQFNLISLNMAYNPCTEDENFRLYVAVFLPNMDYYEYKKITDTEREQGNILFLAELRELVKIEDKKLAVIRQKEKELADAELHSSSFVEYMNSQYLFDKMYENDDEGKALLKIGTEELEEIYNDFKTQFVDYCRQVFEIGQKHYQLRTDEIEQFTRSTEAAKKANQQESIDFMEAFIEVKQELFVKVKALQKELDDAVIDDNIYVEKVEVYFSQFDHIIHDTWKNLMRLELQLYESLEEVNQNFEHNLTEMINNFVEESQAVFTNIRDKEVVFTENLTEAANQFFTSANVGDVEVPEVLKVIMSDKENLVNALGATHDIHMQVIDDREDLLMNRSRTWLDNFIKQLYEDEIKRNRYKILEVTNFLDIQREEFEDMTTLPPPIVDPDDVIED